MARKWSNLNLPGALHFVTGNCINRLPVFTEPKCCLAFLHELKTLNQDWPAKLIALDRFMGKMMNHSQWIMNGGGPMIQRSYRRR